jgi:nucleotide-binding universal stress UspA family protein/glycosyltransferase involved in cell wall biosynthesis
VKKRYITTIFNKIIVPVIYGCDSQSALLIARAISGQDQTFLVGFVRVPEGESLSTAAGPARQVRKTMQELANGEQIRGERVRVSRTPWAELVEIVQEERPDLLVLEWPCQLEALHTTPTEVLAHPPCNLAIVKGPIPERPRNVLVTLRGGPYAELALKLSLSIAKTCRASLTSLHFRAPGALAHHDAPYKGIAHVLTNLQEIKRLEVQGEDPAETILSASRQYDLVVMGATAQPVHTGIIIGPVAETILRQSPAGVVVVKTKRPMPANLESETAGQTAISVLVDKWFAENTYHADEFANLDQLLALKRKQKLSVSLALPALNEEETVGKVIKTLRDALVEQAPLLDEIVLMDSDSTDKTREIARALGVPVYIHQMVLNEYGKRHGKGEALWKSLYVTRGDIVIWIDTDIVNIHPRFVYGLLGAMLFNPGIQFVKGFYRRPLKVGDKMQAGGGGRVTELTARPLLNLFYPELSGVIQPLSGEYGGRRSVLEQLPFFSGYGVEIGLLIDIMEKFGLNAIAQVDLQERIHHNQPLESLSKMSFAIIQAVMRKLERRYERSLLEEVNRTMKLIRYEPGRLFLDIEEIAEQERPPMMSLPEYSQNRS